MLAPPAHADDVRLADADGHGTPKALDARGVTVRTTGKATRSGRRLTLPLASGDAKALRASGALQLRAEAAAA